MSKSLIVPTIGLTEKHTELMSEFLRRLNSILSEQGIELKNYAAGDGYGTPRETVTLQTETFRISIEICGR